MIRFILFCFLALSGFLLKAQPGCTDMNASNFNSSATINDGSCVYPTTVHYPTLMTQLASSLSESSGLTWGKGKLWSHNDSGNSPEIYQVDTATGAVIQTVHLDNYPNVDWEDITADSNYIYVADCGNNSGNRTNLRILRIPFDSIGNGSQVHVNAEAISFSYSDQTTFTASSAHNFDCEAICSKGDWFYLFTKNRGNAQTRVYRLSKIPGIYSISPYTSFNVNGLITGADYNESTNEVVLIGYANFTESFLWFMNDFKADSFFSRNKRRIQLSNTPAWQTEAVTFGADGRFFISCETAGGINASLYAGSKEWLPIGTTLAPSMSSPISVAPNPTSGSVVVSGLRAACTYQVYDSLNRLVLKGELDKNKTRIDLQGFSAGTYFLELEGSTTQKEKVRIIKQ